MVKLHGMPSAFWALGPGKQGQGVCAASQSTTPSDRFGNHHALRLPSRIQGFAFYKVFTDEIVPCLPCIAGGTWKFWGNVLGLLILGRPRFHPTTVPKTLMGWALRNFLVLSALLCVGVAVAAVVVVLVANAEARQSTDAFGQQFAVGVQEFQDFFRVRLQCARAVADALSTHSIDVSNSIVNKVRAVAREVGAARFRPAVADLLRLAERGPVCSPFPQVVRSFGTVLSPVYGSLTVLDRIENTPAVRSEWEADASLRTGTNVTIFTAGFHASDGQPRIWVVSSGYSTSKAQAIQVGRDVSSRIENLRALLDIEAHVADNTTESTTPDTRVPSYSAQVAVTEIFTLTATNTSGFAVMTTIFDGDLAPARIVSVGAVIDSFVKDAKSNQTGAVFEITDHMGHSVTRGDCALHSALTVLSGQVAITTSATWNISIGECPSFRSSYVTWRRWVLLTVILLATVLAMDVYRRMVRKSWAEVEQHTLKSQQQVYSLIVGYVCHEVRNPLHVLRSAFDTLLSAFVDVVTESGRRPSQDTTAMVLDGQNAIDQMQVCYSTQLACVVCCLWPVATASPGHSDEESPVMTACLRVCASASDFRAR